MKKYFISGVLAIAISAVFTGCSKSTDLYDEGAQQASKEAKAQAELAEKYATYETAFVKKFGSIAKGQDWGFGQTRGITLTRAEVYPGANHKHNVIDCGFEIPANVTSQKEGNDGNDIESKMKDGAETVNFIFNNYWMQHYNKADHGHHTEMKAVEAYDSNTNAWVPVTNFTGGQNNAVTYYTKNKNSKGTTLMIGMGGQGDPQNNNALFRWKKSDNTYCYDYRFVIENGELFLGLRYNDDDWWVILITKAVPKSGDPDAEGRILCEDMGEIGDFDFNDVVFDAKIWQDGTITIDVLAAGGILPITIDGVPVALGEMTNTGVNNTGNVQSFTIDAVNGMPKYTNVIDIPVVVNPGGDAAKYELKADIEKAPQKICAPVLTRWPDEYISIERAYSQFADWVRLNNPDQFIEVENEILTNLKLSDNN